MTTLEDKRILLCVSGGIAAYKSASLVRALQREGAKVRVVMSASAEQFITPLTLEVLTGERVGTSLFEPGFEHEIGHIEIARWPDAVVVAPATANVLAKMVVGLADDLLTTALLATTAPVVVCPAMNTQMWQHAATQDNVRRLAARERVYVVDPDAGALACGEVGAGRLPDPPIILAALVSVFARKALPMKGRHVTVTAGPTREAFDAARFLSNPSSGKMGVAIARAARAAGAQVTLIHGPLSVATPIDSACVAITTAAELHEAVKVHARDVLIMAAAVADWRPEVPAVGKTEKSGGPWNPTLVRTADIIAERASAVDRPAYIMGFAAEAHDVVERATAKRLRKGIDAIVANRIGEGGAFGADDNTVWVIDDLGQEQIGPVSKEDVATALVAWLAAALARDTQ
jgi:phosphopantothenoylcysteine decarboxylase/phosphopantothenate--cysteine ligase